ncbi:hypothetical protein MHTCC0001_24060 [Flavobacteriaceae bacterium MHTCC 0001]
MKHITTFFLFFLGILNAQNIVINEVVPRNVITFREYCVRERCPDLIELYNTTSNDIDISNYYLSDDPTDVKKWQMPAGTIIKANSFLMLFGSKSTSSAPIRVNFDLSTKGETLVLSNPSGAEVHQLTYPITQNDVAYGRLSTDNYSFMVPSPDAINPDHLAFEYLDSNLTTSLPSGVYSGSQSVELTHTGPGTIYYTLDGTKPTTSSTPYTGPITINSNTVLKAIVIKNANAFSIVENRSYVIGVNHELPIILLTSDNSTKTFPSRRNKQVIDGRVEFNFIETDGTIAISQYANFRESGNASRFSFPQINGKIEASELYGDNDFDYKMFPNKNIDEFDSFLFRNSGQDWYFTHLRDAFVSRITSEDNLINFPFEGYRPAVLYVNAEYHGIINVREDNDNNYIRDNFDLKDGEFERKGRRSSYIVPDAPLPTDREALNSVINFNNYTNIRFLYNYSDLGEIGFGWWEDLSGKTGQRYHYFIHDFDISFGNAKTFVQKLQAPMAITAMLDGEIEANLAYKNEALQYVAASINHLYNTNRTIGILNKMEGELESEMDAHGLFNVKLNNERNQPFSVAFFKNLSDWKQNMQILRDNVRTRIDANIFDRIRLEYGLDTPIEVTYNSSNINQGFVRVHDVKVQETPSKGTYFSKIPLKLSAEALPGFKFVRWEGDVNSTSINIAPTFTTNASVTAIFEPFVAARNTVVINEVQGKNDNTIADENGEFDDWIEIYNPTSTPINLAGLYFSDNLSEPLKWQIPDTNPSKTTVPAKGFLLLWADKDLNQGENHLNFKLKGSDQVIITYEDRITKKQSIEFFNIDADESYGANTDGSANFIKFTTPTPNASNNGTVLSTQDTSKDKHNFSIYPNPTKNDVTINTSVKSIDLNWKIYTLNGVSLNSGTGKRVTMGHLSSGLYFIKINNHTTLKVVKQ